MNTRMGLMAIALVAATFAANAADNSAEIKSLEDEAKLLEARQKRDKAEADALKAADDLAKAQAASARVPSEIEKANFDSQTALDKAKIGAVLSSVTAIKEVLGAPPTIGNDGTVTISDASNGQLLRIKQGSLALAWDLAIALCARLEAAKIEGAFFAPPELENKIQKSRLLVKELDYLSKEVDRNKDVVSGQITPQAVAAALASMALARYAIDGVMQLSRVARTDYAVALSDTQRGTWLEYFVSSQCNKQVPVVQVEAAVRSQGLDNVIDRLNKLTKFADDVDARKAENTKATAQDKSKLEEEKKKSPPNQATIVALHESIKQKENEGTKLASQDGLVGRIKAIAQTAATKPQEFLDAITWSAFVDPENSNALHQKPRITTVLSTQDGQVIKDNYFLGKRVFGLSSGELIYRVQSSDGKLLAVGYLTATKAMGKIDFEETVPISGDQFPSPAASTQGSTALSDVKE